MLLKVSEQVSSLLLSVSVLISSSLSSFYIMIIINNITIMNILTIIFIITTINVYFSFTAGCPVPIDLGLIVDSSGSISRKNWVKTKNFLKSVANAFELSEKGTHVSVIVYATVAELAIKFNQFKGAHQNSLNLAKEMDTLRHMRGFTYIDRALKLAQDEMFNEANGMRKGVQKVR